ncbi:hypothetical protein [Butyrivibrio fibrisolvens]|uniref:hypothetical protein n=1 Tax=Butyrivibrio fibrisolvens TaxID=831 RepID=UPI00041F4FBD|nr:hypothetical protein [Butyrivibrio fibrisolvens]
MVSANLNILEESLVKKISIMKKIEAENEKQEDLLENFDEVDIEAFDSLLDVKGNYIEELLQIENDFETLFDRVKEEVGRDKDLYTVQIDKINQLLQEINTLSVSIKASEHKNKKLAEKFFSKARQDLLHSKQTSGAAFNYYRTMNNFKDIPPQFLDSKN